MTRGGAGAEEKEVALHIIQQLNGYKIIYRRFTVLDDSG
jgi:hypothetical protein